MELITKLSVIAPCYYEQKTLRDIVRKVLAIKDEHLVLEINITDDCSKDKSLELAQSLQKTHPEIKVLHRKNNQVKGAALHRGIKNASGDYVVVQYANLEYDSKDRWRALYCILRYNLNKVPWPVQMFFYLFIGGTAAILNLTIFLELQRLNFALLYSTGIAFIIAAIFYYIFCIQRALFRHKARWNSFTETILFAKVVGADGVVDFTTRFFINSSLTTGIVKILSVAIGLLLIFFSRKWFTFTELSIKDWKRQTFGIPSMGIVNS
jgi:glycosyltransferase involved in cell wall biosynthesis